MLEKAEQRNMQTQRTESNESLVAFMRDDRFGPILITYRGNMLAYHVEISGPFMADFFNDKYPEDAGLWIWEGTVTMNPSWRGYSTDDEANYSGQWRRLNEKELNNLAMYGAPWVETNNQNC